MINYERGTGRYKNNRYRKTGEMKILKKLVFIVILLFFVYREYSTYHSGSQVSKESKENYLKLQETSCEIDGGYVYIKGFIKNNGNENYYFVEVKSSVHDESKALLDMESSIAVGSEGIGPNERKSFDVMIPYVEGIQGCQNNITSFE